MESSKQSIHMNIAFCVLYQCSIGTSIDRDHAWDHSQNTNYGCSHDSPDLLRNSNVWDVRRGRLGTLNLCICPIPLSRSFCEESLNVT